MGGGGGVGGSGTLLIGGQPLSIGLTCLCTQLLHTNLPDPFLAESLCVPRSQLNNNTLPLHPDFNSQVDSASSAENCCFYYVPGNISHKGTLKVESLWRQSCFVAFFSRLQVIDPTGFTWISVGSKLSHCWPCDTFGAESWWRICSQLLLSVDSSCCSQGLCCDSGSKGGLYLEWGWD